MVRSIKACNRNSHIYHIDTRKSTDPNNSVVEFEVCLFYREAEDGNFHEQKVAVIEGTRSRSVFEKYYERNQPSVIVNLDFYESVRKIDGNWKNYADKYEQNHAP